MTDPTDIQEVPQAVVDVVTTPPAAAGAESPFLENLAETLSEKQLEEIGAKVCEDYDSDLSSRSEWTKKRANWLKLLAGYRDPKSFPYEGCANVHIPVMGIACIQFQSRAYEALLPPKEYAKCFPTDGKALESSARAGKYLNWQLTEQMEEWEEDMDVLFLLLPLNGSAYKKTYYDSNLGRNVSRVIDVENFVTPYKCKRLEDAPRKTHVYHSQLNEIRAKVRTGIYLMAAPSADGDGRMYAPSQEISEQADKINGMSAPAQGSKDTRMHLEQHRGWDIDGDGIDEPYMITVDYETKKVLRIESLEYTDPVTQKKKVMEYFTGYTFIPNPESHYGFGFGHLLEGLNEAANATINELLDAGSLANAQSGFVNKRSGIKAGNIQIAAGKLNPVDISADDIRKAIYMIDFKEPSEALFKLLGLLIGFAKEISSISESMMGKLPPSDTTATTMLAVMEQGLKVFSTIHKRAHRSFRKELRKIFTLNRMYMDEQVYFMVQDSTSGDMLGFQSGRVDFINNIDVIPVSDPNITSRAEKLIKAKQAYEIGIGNPLIQKDEEAIYQLTKQFYEAIEQPNIAAIVKKPAPPPEPPDLSQIEENALFLQEKYTKPLPHQDHMAHLAAMEEFLASPWIEQLTPQGKKLIEMHKQETLSLAYVASKQKEAEMEQALMMMEAMNGGGSVQPGGMEGMADSAAYLRGIEKIGAPAR